MSGLYNSDKLSIIVIHTNTTHTFICISMHLKTLHIAHYDHHFLLSIELLCALSDMIMFYSCQKYWIISYQYAHPPRMFIENCNMFKSNKLCSKWAFFANPNTFYGCSSCIVITNFWCWTWHWSKPNSRYQLIQWHRSMKLCKHVVHSRSSTN